MPIDMALYMKNRRAIRREMLIEHLGGRCVVCGTPRDLQIDHIDSSQKSFTLSGKTLDRAWTAILAEAAKCQLLCYLHHREKTVAAGETGGGWNRIENPDHGTERMYRGRKCKCDLCRAWKRDYRKGLVDARGRPR